MAKSITTLREGSAASWLAGWRISKQLLSLPPCLSFFLLLLSRSTKNFCPRFHFAFPFAFDQPRLCGAAPEKMPLRVAKEAVFCLDFTLEKQKDFSPFEATIPELVYRKCASENIAFAFDAEKVGLTFGKVKAEVSFRTCNLRRKNLLRCTPISDGSLCSRTPFDRSQTK